MTVNPPPAAWIGCLGCYNAGTLTGKWFGPDEMPQDMAEFNEAIGFTDAELARNLVEKGIEIKGVAVSQDHGHPVYGPHEELWVFDHEEWHGFLKGECSPAQAASVWAIIEAIEESGYPLDAVAAWRDNGNDVLEWDAPTRDAFASSYAGEYDNDRDFAYDYLDNTSFWEEVPEHVQQYRGAIVESWINDNVTHGNVWSAPSAEAGKRYYFNE